MTCNDASRRVVDSIVLVAAVNRVNWLHTHTIYGALELIHIHTTMEATYYQVGGWRGDYPWGRERCLLLIVAARRLKGSTSQYHITDM